MADDDTQVSPPSVSPPGGMPQGAPPGVVAGGGGTPQSGNLPPSGQPMQRPVAKLGLEARGAEVAKGAIKGLEIALTLIGSTSKQGSVIARAITMLGKEFGHETQQGGGMQDPLMQALAKAQAGPMARGTPSPTPTPPPPGAGPMGGMTA